MKAAEFRAILKELRLTQTAVRERLGLNKSTVSRWAMGELDVPQYAVAFLESEKKLRDAEIIC